MISYKNILALLIILIISCNSHKESKWRLSFNKEYTGFWAETIWTYQFKRNGTFVFKSEGHYGTIEESGQYVILDSIILLNPKTDWQVYDGVLQTKFKITNNNCLRDYDNNSYCMSLDSLNFQINKKYEWEEKTEEIINNLPITIKVKGAVSDSSTFDLQFNRIANIDFKEFYLFSLYERKHLKRFPKLNFVVKKNPFEIYQHHSINDSLSLIYKQD